MNKIIIIMAITLVLSAAAVLASQGTMRTVVLEQNAPEAVLVSASGFPDVHPAKGRVTLFIPDLGYFQAAALKLSSKGRGSLVLPLELGAERGVYDLRVSFRAGSEHKTRWRTVVLES